MKDFEDFIQECSHEDKTQDVTAQPATQQNSNTTLTELTSPSKIADRILNPPMGQTGLNAPVSNKFNMDSWP